MKVAWSSADLRQVCVSKHGLDTAARGNADDARLLLTLIARADDLAQLHGLSCVTIEYTSAGAGAVIRLGVLEIDAVVVQPASGRRLVREVSTQTGLMIQQIRVAGQPLLRAAG